MRIRFARLFVLVLVVLGAGRTASFGQSTNAAVGGQITDQAGRSVPGATVVFTNLNTNVAFTTHANDQGIYSLPNLPPGIYRENVTKDGFKSIVKGDIELHVQDIASINFQMQVGSVTESVTVEGGAPLLNTQDGSVSTVVDRQFVKDIPLNGRSFQALIALTPGVVLTPASEFGDQGQFSVNGQRADANYFTIDGVSANFGVSAYPLPGQNAGGTLPAMSSQGGTNSLVSVDAMQEFRIQTSTFAPEYGRSPGGQVSIVTRSGTNSFHGTAFEYFRNDVLDANDWFSNHNHLPKPQERQNDFGGVFGGPVIIPGLYNGHDHTFFFFSYEGLRLRQPLTLETSVPDTASRNAAPASIQPYLNAYPIQNGPELGGGFAQFNASYSNPSTLDAYSIRLDHIINSRLTMFGRYSNSPSNASLRAAAGGVTGATASVINATPFDMYTVTFGLTAALQSNLNNEFRANYSSAKASNTYKVDNLGGAVPPPLPTGFSGNANASNSEFWFGFLGGPVYQIGSAGADGQRQLNFVDNLTLARGSHQVKFGVDYRSLAPWTYLSTYYQNATFANMAGALASTPSYVYLGNAQPTSLRSYNISLYGEDTWRLSTRLTLTYGVRWDVNPPIRGSNISNEPFTINGLGTPSNMSLAPRGTPLYATTYGNIAPRFGVAYQLRQRTNWTTVLRGGFGVFYDSALGSLGDVGNYFPFKANKYVFGAQWPLTPALTTPPPITTTPSASQLFVAEPNLTLPRTYEWNVALEQALRAHQTLSLSYIGAVGRELLRVTGLYNPNPQFGFVGVMSNSGTSDYHALQVKFQKQLSAGVQALASYTWAHSIDTGSNDVAYATNTPGGIAPASVDRGPSDFDIRQSLTGGITYALPGPKSDLALRRLFGGWSTDVLLLARSALPVNLTGDYSFAGGTIYQTRPDLVAGQPFYLIGSQYPGGKAFNPKAFAAAKGEQGTLGRNDLRGFRATQLDFALARGFQLKENARLEFRTEFFNVLNHPNFGSPVNSITSPFFGLSTQTLASSMGSGGANGGFNPLYQIGGPRSIQLALRLTF